MTASLARAFEKASHLSAAAQKQWAEQMLRDIEGELKWPDTLARSRHLLEKMAARARAAGKLDERFPKALIHCDFIAHS